MMLNKKRKISATAILSCNLMSINGTIIQWVDAKDFNLADLVKTIGIDNDHKAKAMITIEIVEQPCEICGKPTSGDKLRQMRQTNLRLLRHDRRHRQTLPNMLQLKQTITSNIILLLSPTI